MNTLNIIVEILIALGVIITPIGFIAGIILAILMAEEKTDQVKRKKLRGWMISSFAIGPVALFLLLSLWGLVRIITQTYVV